MLSKKEIMLVVLNMLLLNISYSNLPQRQPEVTEELLQLLSKEERNIRIPSVVLPILDSTLNANVAPTAPTTTLRMSARKPQGMHVDVRFSGEVLGRASSAIAHHCREECENNSQSCTANVLFLIYLPKAMYVDPYELQFRHSFGCPGVTIHLSSQFRAQFSPEAFAEDSQSCWVAVELEDLNLNTSNCVAAFDFTFPVHMRYRAHLLQSASDRRNDPKFDDGYDDDEVSGMRAALQTDDGPAVRSRLMPKASVDSTHLSAAEEKGVIRSLLREAEEGFDGNTKAFKRSHEQAEDSASVRYGYYLGSILPAPIVMVRPSGSGGGVYVRTRVVSSRQCALCATTESTDNMRELEESCDTFLAGEGCMPPFLELQMPAGLLSHIPLVLWSTVVVLILSTYALSWLLLHPKKRGITVSALQSLHPGSD